MGMHPVLGQKKNGLNLDLNEVVESEKSNYRPVEFQERVEASYYDVKYYRLELSVNPDTLFVTGKVTVYFVPNTALNVITFDLNSVLLVDSISHSGFWQAFSHTENVIEVQKDFAGNKLDSLTIYYHGQPPPNGTSFVQSEHNGKPIIWTLSEPYGAIDWWPHKQSLTDKADSIDIFTRTPLGNKVAGNGVLIRESKIGNELETHWKCRYPIVPYLVAISVTDYAEISFYSSLVTGNLFVQNYVYVEDSATVLEDLMVTDTLLRFYDSLISPYPFMNEKYGHAQFGRGGGMEHQTMSFMYHFGFGLTAHELAHQWFGDMITCGSWQDIWLNEGFATYFAGLPLETMYGGAEWFAWKQKNLDRCTSEPEGSVFVRDTTDVGRIFNPNLSYAKGAYVLHMLRGQIGDVPFFNGIRSYVNDPTLKYKTALTDDFFRHMEASADTSLNLFMTQWIYGKGYPSFNLEWEQIGDKLSIQLAQTTSNSSVDFFYLDVPILLEGVNGEQEFIKLKHYETGQLFEVHLDFKVVRIIVDPELGIISKANFVINKSSFTELVVYPNPTTNQVQVVPAGSFSRVTGYKIISMEGKLITEELGLVQTTPWTIDLAQLAQGNYKLVLYSGNEVITKSVVIAR